jgi:hypothetical protein
MRAAANEQPNTVTRDATLEPSLMRSDAAQRQWVYHQRRKRAAIEAIGNEADASRVTLVALLARELAVLEDTPPHRRASSPRATPPDASSPKSSRVMALSSSYELTPRPRHTTQLPRTQGLHRAPAVDKPPVHRSSLWTAPSGSAPCPPLPGVRPPGLTRFACPLH